jgi:hypothetical protein
MIVEIGRAGLDDVRETYWQKHATGSVRWGGWPRSSEMLRQDGTFRPKPPSLILQL